MAAPAQINSPLNPCTIVCSAGIGCIAAATLTQTHPIAGLVFGGIYHVVTYLAEEALCCLGESEVAKTARIILGILAGTAAAALVLILFGATMSVEAACTLTLAMAISRFTQPLFCCACIANCVGCAAATIPLRI